MVSDLGQGAAAYASRTTRSRRLSRFSNSLSGLVQFADGPLSGEEFALSDSPKRWIREVPGSKNELGEVVRSDSPPRLSSRTRSTTESLRLSSTSRNAFSSMFGRRTSVLLPKNLFYYCLLLFPIIAAMPTLMRYIRSFKVASEVPDIPDSVLQSEGINPIFLQFLKENKEYVTALSSKIAELGRIRDEDAKSLVILQAQLSEHKAAQDKLVSDVKGLSVQKAESGTVTRSDLDKLLLELENSKADLSISILEQKSQLQELASRKFNSGSSDNLEKLIDRAFYKHLADGTELVDYALETTGGSIISVSSTHSGSIGVFGFATKYLLASQKCNEMIRPQVAPGQCWPMTGHSGWAIISLSDSIIPTAVTLEHVAPEIAPHFESAPKEFSLAAVNGTGEMKSLIQLGFWKYRKPIPGDMPVIQTFPIVTTLQHPVSTVNFTVHSNYGGNYTCIYRVRIHGKPEP